ncbi:MAG: hypothetical protein JXL97_04985 [Bacteroidales bacterium]|nr:hypothetical protein [Bacteroidales bacterium]
MENSNQYDHVFKSKTGQKEKKGVKKNTKFGWYVFLFIVFIAVYAFFSFVVFK